jgi:hypothetical protein
MGVFQLHLSGYIHMEYHHYLVGVQFYPGGCPLYAGGKYSADVHSLCFVQENKDSSRQKLGVIRLCALLDYF